MKPIIKKLLAIFITLSVSINVLAIDMDYYAPNGSPTVSDAFTRLALIFNDGDYYYAIPIIGMLSLIIVVINGYLIKPLTSSGKTDNPIGIFAPLAIGSIIWIAGFVPTATIHVYDPVKNDTQSIAGVPQAIVLLAGLTNILERNMIEITETGTAYPYSETAGGINLELFINANLARYNNRKKFLGRDIQAYYEDCGKVNLVLAGNQSFEDMMTNTPELYTLLSEWTHPSSYVNLYNNTPGKTNMSCTDGWNNVIKPNLSVTAFDSKVANICAKSMFDPLIPAQLQQCKNRLGELKEIHGLTATTANNYLRDSFIAGEIIKKINLEDPIEAQQTLMRRQLALQGLGALNTAEDTMPNLKSVMTAIMFGIIPFLMLFLLTPLWPKALKFMAGGILWLTTWGVMMAVMHTATMDQAMIILSDIAANKMGLDAFILAQTDGVKAFMLFGKMQSNSLMLAIAIAMAVYGFGSYAMTGIAQGQAQSMQNTGEGAAQQALTPEGRAGVRNSLIGGMSSDAGVQYENMPSGGMGSEAQLQKLLGGAAKNLSEGLNTDIGANRAIGEHNAGSDSGRGQSYQDFANNNGASIANKATAQAYAQTNQGQADATLLADMQKVAGAGDSQAGAALFAASNATQFAQLNKLQNMAELQGMDSNSPQDLLKINEDMANNKGNISMTGQEIFNSPIVDKLNQQQLKDLNNNWNTPVAVNPSFNSDGSLKGVDIGNAINTNFSQKSTTDNSTVHDSSQTSKTGNFVGLGVGGTATSMLKGTEDYPQDGTPQEKQDWGIHRQALQQTFSKAYANQDGTEATYLANTLSGDLNQIVSGSKSNSDIMSVATNEGVKGGWDASKALGGLFTGVTGITANVDVGGNAEQRQNWTNDHSAQVNNAMVRGMLENSDGNIDKFNQDYMNYKNALLEMGKEAKEGSDLDGKK